MIFKMYIFLCIEILKHVDQDKQNGSLIPLHKTGITYYPRSISLTHIYVCICIYVYMHLRRYQHKYTLTHPYRHTLVDNSVFNYSIYPINIKIYRIISIISVREKVCTHQWKMYQYH